MTDGGGRGAIEGGGGGGGAGGAGEVDFGGSTGAEGGGGCGARPDGFRDDGGGIGGFFPIGGGFGFEETSEADPTDCGTGRRLFLSAETEGLLTGAGGGAGGRPGGAPGGLGALGGFDADSDGGCGVVRDDSVSDRYEESASAPVLTPPDFLSFGMPPANRPPSCGAADMALAPPPPVSLFDLALPSGTDGARPPGGFGIPPGTGGAPITGPPPVLFFSFPSTGADRSLICVTFFNLVPFSMSPNSAP